MNWKVKAQIQNIVDMLPSSISYEIYYFIQRKIGRLKKLDARPIILGAIKSWTLIIEAGFEPKNKVFFETGTGRTPIVPIIFWLLGAKQIITMDLNPYMKKELVEDSIQYLFDNEDELRILFNNYLDEQRFVKLSNYYKNNVFNLDELLTLCSIKYIAPGDATNTGIASNSIDFHTSFTVYEHIPEKVLTQIIKEGNRIVKNEGLFINAIDYFDHFMHFDNKISSINFLQYSDYEWNKYAGNRYMYMNRLRHDDFIELFHNANHKILLEETVVDKKALELLHSGLLILNNQFATKSNEVNSIASSWIVSKNIG